MIFMHDWNIKYSSSLSVFKSELKKKTLTKSLQIPITFLKIFLIDDIHCLYSLYCLYCGSEGNCVFFFLQCLRYIQQRDNLSKQLNDINVPFQMNCILYGSPDFSYNFIFSCDLFY